MDGSEQSPTDSTMLERFEAMGLEVNPLPGGRVATVTLPVSEEPFPGAGGDLRVKQVQFATVGAQAIKCLLPEAFFYLPLIPVSDCTDPADLEQRIRGAWRQHAARVERGRGRLERLGMEFDTESGGGVLAFDLDVGDGAARARTSDLSAVVLPGRGPLSGQLLDGPEARCFRPDNGIDSSLDLQIEITTHLEQLARDSTDRDTERRAEAAREKGRAARRVQRRGHRVLLVGPGLASNTALAESLRMRGYAVDTAANDADAMDSFCRSSYELMLVDAQLGRSDGLELVPLIQTLAGVEKLPVVIVDAHPRDAVRERAKQIGAVGYLTAPVDAARIAPGLARLLQAPQYRRYSRYSERVAVRCGALRAPGFTTAIGRLGMFVRTSLDVRLHTLHDFEVAVPYLGHVLRVEGEIVYKGAPSNESEGGLGIRFHHFVDGDERRLIEFLQELEPAAEEIRRNARAR